jgi:hypothetical protein
MLNETKEVMIAETDAEKSANELVAKADDIGKNLQNMVATYEGHIRKHLGNGLLKNKDANFKHDFDVIKKDVENIVEEIKHFIHHGATPKVNPFTSIPTTPFTGATHEITPAVNQVEQTNVGSVATATGAGETALATESK